MKKYLYIIFAGAVAVLPFACTKEIGTTDTVPGKTPERITFEAGNMAMRTSLSDNDVLWSDEDELSVFDSERTNNRFSQSELSQDGTTASFTGEAVSSETFYAVYPYRVSNSSASDGVIKTYLSPDQFAVSNSFGPGANLSLGISESDGDDKFFTMQQVGAFVKFSFSGCSTVTSICLKSINGEKISGGVTATCTDGIFSAVSDNDGSALDEVTLYPAAGESYIAPGTYFAVLLPGTLASGLQILFTEVTDGVEKVIAAKVPESITLAKNTISAIPNTIALPAVSHAAWMEQETISVLFKEPQHLLDGEGTASLPFDAPENYNAQTVTVDDYSIGVHFSTKTPGLSSTSGFNVSSGTNNGWRFALPTVSGKKLAKVEYYTSAASGVNKPCITNMAKDYGTVYGAVNEAGAPYSKYVWNLDLSVGCWLTWYGDASHKGNVALNGFRAIYRDADGPAKAVISVTTEVDNVFIDQDVVLNASFASYDNTSDGYTCGFEYKAASVASPVFSPRKVSSGESFSEGANYSLSSDQADEWTSVEAEFGSGLDFSATVSSLTRGQAYYVRAWARVGDEGEIVYGDQQLTGLLSAVSSDKTWQYGTDEYFTVWQNATNNSNDEYNYHWDERYSSMTSYKYGSDGLLFESNDATEDVMFRSRSYLKFLTSHQFSFISAESGTATISMECASTSSSLRTIKVYINDGVSPVETFESGASGDYSAVTSEGFAVNEGDKIRIKVSGNANLKSIAFACEAQEASFIAEVDANSKSDRNTVYNFTVTASDDIEWSAAVTTGDADGVELSTDSGTGSGSFTLTVPVNYAWGSGVAYAVTVSTSDERIVEGNRTQVFNLTQAQPTKVLFGCEWGNAFWTAYSDSYAQNTSFTAQLATIVSSYASLPSATVNGSHYVRGNITFSFTAGEAGKGVLSFYARVAGGKTLDVRKNGSTVGGSYPYSPAANEDKNHTVTISVAANDVISIVTSGSGNHYLYIGARPITWSLAPEE